MARRVALFSACRQAGRICKAIVCVRFHCVGLNAMITKKCLDPEFPLQKVAWSLCVWLLMWIPDVNFILTIIHSLSTEGLIFYPPCLSDDPLPLLASHWPCISSSQSHRFLMKAGQKAKHSFSGNSVNKSVPRYTASPSSPCQESHNENTSSAMIWRERRLLLQAARTVDFAISFPAAVCIVPGEVISTEERLGAHKWKDLLLWWKSCISWCIVLFTFEWGAVRLWFMLCSCGVASICWWRGK